MKNNKMFAEFDPVSTKAWKQKIQVDLKGADYNETLVWETPEGINIKPFYNADDVSEHLKPPRPPEQWYIGQHIYVKETAAANQEAHDLLAKGVESLLLRISGTAVAPEALFKGIPLESVPIYLEFDSFSADLINPFLDFAKNVEGSFFFGLNPLGNLARTGNWYTNEKDDLALLETVLRSNTRPCMLQVDLGLYHNAGAHTVQQLAYALAEAHEYLLRYREHLKDLKDSTSPICFRVSIGGNYFTEIAKIRALRLLWQSLTAEYGLETSCNILAQPATRNKTLYDYNVNMLRSTTESMAAILGGANTIVNLPYDSLYHDPNDFGDRIARNQLLILKKESYFDKVSNAAEGAYYIESLTYQLAEKALALFKTLEQGGGWLKKLLSNTLQRKIQESAVREQQAYDSGQLVLIGSNKYPNPEDKMKNNLQKSPFIKKEARKTLAEPIIEKRLAEKEEQKRLQDE